MKMPKMKKLPSLPKLNISQFLGLVNYNRNTIFVIGALLAVVVNIIILPLSLRIDFSRNRANTLSDSSKKIIRSLDRNVGIVLFQSSDLPTRLQPIKQDVTDLLNEYRREGRSKVIVETKDPKNDEKARQEAIAAGIGELRFSQVEQNQFNVSNGYFGIMVKVGEQTRAIPQLADLENLEYNLTSAIYSLVRTESPKIAIVSNPADFNGQGGDPLGILKEVLQQQYTLEPLEFASPAPPPIDESLGTQTTPVPDNRRIDPSIKTIVFVANSTSEYSDQDIARLNDYIKEKGKVIALLDGVGINEQLLATEEAKHNLFKFTEAYGITVNKDLVLSTTAELVNFGDQVQSLFIPYPYWFRANAFSNEVSLFSNVNYVTFPWASSLTLREVEGFTTQEIVRTDPQSWRETGQFILDPQQLAQSQPGNFTYFTVGAVATHENGGKLLVIPSSRFAQAQYLSPESGNVNFLLNAVNNYASDGALSGIRQRSVSIHSLPTFSTSMRDIFKYGNMLLLPALFALGGTFYLLRRR